jgi:hypothetical protein
MKYICKKILDEIGIEYDNDFNNSNDYIFNFDKSKNNNFNFYNSHKIDIESASFISEYTDFEYNNTIEKIFNIKDDTNKDEYKKIYNNIKNKDQYKLKSNYNIFNINKNMPIQTSKILTNIITQNPFLNKGEVKKKILSKILQYLRNLCDKIKQMQNNNKSKFNYFTGERVNDNPREIDDLNYKEINENKNIKLNKANVLKQLKEHQNELKTFSVLNKEKLLIKKEDNIQEEDIKTKIVSIINSYHDINIKKNWETMNKVWYQNNQRFNPIFKINNLTKTNNIINPNNNNSNNNNNNNNRDNNHRQQRHNNERGSTNNTNIFSHLQTLKTNQ